MPAMPTCSPDPMAVYDGWRVAQAEAVRLIREGRDDEAARLLSKVGGQFLEDARADVSRLRYGMWLRGLLPEGARP